MYSHTGRPMLLLDREGAWHAFGHELAALAASGRSSAESAFEVSGDPAPYAEFLPGLRVLKGEKEYPKCHLAGDRWL